MQTIIITGGMGYIGSHVYVELYDKYKVVIIDKKSNILTAFPGFVFYQMDLLDKDGLDEIFQKYKPYAVLHFAGLKSIKESIKEPLRYYQNNVISTLNILEMMNKYECYNLIFSSSATVYGKQDPPFCESMQLEFNGNPYGQIKCVIEQMLNDICASNDKWHIVSLRYFNPIGAHSSGLIGENFQDNPNNLMPLIVKAALTNQPIHVYGTNYDTHDGSCVRDYIHVVDIARGHTNVLNKINSMKGYHYYNLGTGRGTSVLQLLNIFQKVNQIELNVIYGERREGDIPIMYCSPDKANKELNWNAELSLENMCRDSWNYIQKNEKNNC